MAAALAHSQQLDLFAPDRWPHKPWCKTDKAYKPVVRTLARSAVYPYIQPNMPTIIWRLPFDVDRPGAIHAWEAANVAPFNWACETPESRHAHGVYEIEIPVRYLVGGADTKPMRFLAALEAAYGRALGADPAYSGHYVKNPNSDRWALHVFRPQPYSLTELAEWVELPRKTDMRRLPDLDSVTGRNCYLFEALRKWAYRAVRNYWRPDGYRHWMVAVYDKAMTINDEIESQWPARGPLHMPEMDDVVKSVGNWVWQHFTPASFREMVARTHTPELQQARGIKSGKARLLASQEKRARARLLQSQGMTQQAIAAEMGVHRNTVAAWLENAQ